MSLRLTALRRRAIPPGLGSGYDWPGRSRDAHVAGGGPRSQLGEVSRCSLFGGASSLADLPPRSGARAGLRRRPAFTLSENPLLEIASKEADVLTEPNARNAPLASSRAHPALAKAKQYCRIAHPQQRLGEWPVWTHVATPRRAGGGSGSAAPNRPGERARLRERGACAARPRRRPDAIRWIGSALRRRRRGSWTWVRDLSDIDRCPTSSGHRKRIASLPDSAATARPARSGHVRSTIAELHAGGKRAFPLHAERPQ